MDQVERHAMRELVVALKVLLDCVDFTAGNCSPVEMVAAVLPKEVIDSAKSRIEAAEELL